MIVMVGPKGTLYHPYNNTNLLVVKMLFFLGTMKECEFGTVKLVNKVRI